MTEAPEEGGADVGNTLKQICLSVEGEMSGNIMWNGHSYRVNRIYQSSKSYHRNQGRGAQWSQAGFQLLLIEVAAPTHVPARTNTSVVTRARRGRTGGRETIRQERSAG